MLAYTPLMLALPLAGFIILGAGGNSLPKWLVNLIGCGSVALAFILALTDFFAYGASSAPYDIVLWRWVTSGTLEIHAGLLVDKLSIIMTMVVTGVGFLIHIYSIGYMGEDPAYERFFAFMNFFITAMLLLVLADNFLFLLIGWAGVGLASFLLIGFWWRKPSAVKAAQKAFVVNVIGDFGLMIAIFLLVGKTGSLNFTDTLFARAGLFSAGDQTTTIIAFMLLIAAAAKSAQLPLHVWLPDAMEGPTPVSALIHAATMVTAGVYLVARCTAIFSAAPYALETVGIMGGASALFAATAALFQYDIKRVLAYSTMSQLGYMFMAESVGANSAAIFHLTTHAFFKALLFMSAGAVIHALHGEQDMRKMGGLRKKLPVAFWSFLIGGLALAGIPPFAGFWSKDAILGAIFTQAGATGSAWEYVLWMIGVITAILTGLYIFRLIFVVFYGSYRGAEQKSSGGRFAIHEAGLAMTDPMTALLALSIIGGFDGVPGVDTIGNYLQSAIGLSPAAQGSQLVILLFVGVLAAAGGIFIAWQLYLARPFRFTPNKNPLYQLFANAYYIDALYNAVIVQPIVQLGSGLNTLLETWTLDGGSRAIAGGVDLLSRALRKLQSGYARNYALSIVIGALLIVAFVVLNH